MENININTLRFLSVLNGLAEKSKSGILPLDAYNGTQTGIIYDPSIEFEERGDASIKVHPVVSAIGFPDGVIKGKAMVSQICKKSLILKFSCII